MTEQFFSRHSEIPAKASGPRLLGGEIRRSEAGFYPKARWRRLAFVSLVPWLVVPSAPPASLRQLCQERKGRSLRRFARALARNSGPSRGEAPARHSEIPPEFS